MKKNYCLFQIDKDSTHNRNCAVANLRKAMVENCSQVMQETSFVVKFPADNDHSNHASGDVSAKIVVINITVFLIS